MPMRRDFLNFPRSSLYNDHCPYRQDLTFIFIGISDRYAKVGGESVDQRALVIPGNQTSSGNNAANNITMVEPSGGSESSVL